ncbi:MAG: hypothetical protein ABIP27_01435 [Flavobacterium circumlabens]|uniref:hypothetical protein n=1 Tax=Flavobacterium circumlabens TaxID=2133765 RepID=UPI0032664DCA
MKEEKQFGELFGFRHNEVATIVGVTEGLWSMYAIGRRLLPTRAYLRLAKMIVFEEQQKNNPPAIRQLEPEQRKDWEDKLKLNQINQHNTMKKLREHQEKYEPARKGLELLAFMTDELQIPDFVADEMEKRSKDKFFPVIQARLEGVIERNSLHLQEQYEVKLQVLQFEEKCLKEKLSVV